MFDPYIYHFNVRWRHASLLGDENCCRNSSNFPSTGGTFITTYLLACACALHTLAYDCLSHNPPWIGKVLPGGVGLLDDAFNHPCLVNKLVRLTGLILSLFSQKSSAIDCENKNI